MTNECQDLQPALFILPDRLTLAIGRDFNSEKINDLKLFNKINT